MHAAGVVDRGVDAAEGNSFLTGTHTNGHPTSVDVNAREGTGPPNIVHAGGPVAARIDRGAHVPTRARTASTDRTSASFELGGITPLAASEENAITLGTGESATFAGGVGDGLKA